MRLQAVDIFCPECDELLTFRTPPRLNQRAKCASCRATLLVIEVDPLEIVALQNRRAPKRAPRQEEFDW